MSRLARGSISGSELLEEIPAPFEGLPVQCRKLALSRRRAKNRERRIIGLEQTYKARESGD
jgi:hypothetical protein